MKTLTLKGIDHCHYEILGDILFLKIIPNSVSKISEGSDLRSMIYENSLFLAIRELEKVKLTKYKLR